MSGPAMFNDPPVRTDAMLTLLRAVQQRLLLLTAAATVLGAGLGYLLAGLAGVWGALLAAALGLVFMIATVAALRLVAGRGPEILQLVLVGGWIVKMILVVLALIWLRSQDFYHRGVFFGTLVVVVLGGVLIEIVSVANARIPYVEVPMPAPEADVSSVTAPDGPSATDRDAVQEPQDAAAGAGNGDPAEGPRAEDPSGRHGPEQGSPSGRV